MSIVEVFVLPAALRLDSQCRWVESVCENVLQDEVEVVLVHPRELDVHSDGLVLVGREEESHDWILGENPTFCRSDDEFCSSVVLSLTCNDLKPDSCANTSMSQCLCFGVDEQFSVICVTLFVLSSTDHLTDFCKNKDKCCRRPQILKKEKHFWTIRSESQTNTDVPSAS